MLRSTIFVFFLCAFAAQAQVIFPSEKTSSDVVRFQEFVKANLVYPEDARKSGIEGVVHVQVLFDLSNQIIPGTVRIASGLCEKCDQEVLRVTLLYKEKFPSFSDLDKTVPYIFPVRFSLGGKPPEVERAPHPIAEPFKAVVAEKGSKTISPNWSIYPTSELDTPFKTIKPGDTVKVVGWGAWCFMIESPFVTGYISYRSLQSSTMVDLVKGLIEAKSEEEQKPSVPKYVNKSAPNFDTVAVLSSGTAGFELSAEKKQIYVGECVPISISFNVAELNRYPIQFTDLGMQLSELLRTGLRQETCLVVSDMIEDIKGAELTRGDSLLTQYMIYRANYCPLEPGALKFPKMNLKMILHNLNGSETRMNFPSRPVSVNVLPLPQGSIAPTVSNGFSMAGKFTMTEFTSRETIAANTLFKYTLTVTGNAFTTIMDPPTLTIPGMKIKVIDMTDENNSKDELQLSRKFIYSCMAEREGEFDLTDKIIYTYFNTVTKRMESLRSRLKIKVVANTGKTDTWTNDTNFGRKNFFVAFDASQSMKIEDYTPTRLDAVKQGIRTFIAKNTACDVGLIAFGADMKHLARTGSNACYSNNDINRINFDQFKNGTAIGDAIFFAISSAKKESATTLVLIGDGDNTAGVLDVRQAASIAKSKGVKIFTIGVGHPGDVPFGTDALGRKNMISNTFSDRDFKFISKMTGGMYYWAKDGAAVGEILRKIYDGVGN